MHLLLLTMVAALSAAPLAPLSGTWIESVALGDGTDASVTPPLGATGPRPLVIAVHGAGDRPEWACGEWRGVVDAYAFVACPHGMPYNHAFVWSSVDQLDKRVMATVAAVRARYGAYVDAGSVIYVGFSQGSNLAPYVVSKHADVFPTMALDEGAYGSAAEATGVTRVLLACSTGACDTRFAASAAALGRRHTDVHVASLGTVGHTMNAVTIAALQREWKWLVRDDARWSPWLAGH